MTVKNATVIQGPRQSGRTHQFVTKLEETIKSFPGRNIVVCSTTFKMGRINEMVRGDDYFDSRIFIIHPIDKLVRVLIDGKVRRMSLDEFQDTIYSELKDVILFIEEPTLRASREASGGLMGTGEVSEVTYTTLGKYSDTTSRILFGENVLLTKPFDITLIRTYFDEHSGKFTTTEEYL